MLRSAARTRLAQRPLSTVPASKPRHGVRNFLVSSAVAATGFYAASTYASIHLSDQYRDFFTQNVPLADSLVDYFDVSPALPKDLGRNKFSPPPQIRETPKIQQIAHKVVEKTDKAVENSKTAAKQLRTDVQAVKEQAKDLKDEVKEEAKPVAKQTAAKVESKTAEIKQSVKETASAVNAKVTEVKDKAEDAIHDLKAKAEAALGLSNTAPLVETPRDSTPIDYQKPRQLTAERVPHESPELQLYEAPLPLGFEPPPGYTTSKPKKVTKAKSEPEPLPLVAPSVHDIAASEPEVAQLANTIDSLASFLSTNNASTDSAAKVLTSAQGDLKKLVARLESIKQEEKKQLQEQLEKKSVEYSSQLAAQERQMIERLESQEEDWKKAFDTERDEIVQAYKAKLQSELETQQAIIQARLQEEVVAQGVELQRKWLSEVKSRVEEERGGRLGKLDQLEGGLKELREVSEGTSDWLDQSIAVGKLWTAIRAATDSSLTPNRPFTAELEALTHLAEQASATPEDPLLVPVMASIAPTAATTGIHTLGQLSSWYTTRLTPKIRKAAFLPEHAGPLHYFVSSLLSNLLFITSASAQWKDNDVLSVLSRAEWHLENRDLKSAVREINALKGWPKILARDWLECARRSLEVSQALKVAETEALLSSLLIS